ncbi:MAG: hypothetical protein K2J48_04320 [Muribaculaceae bacterium]|nr:hypothetical protein [Muribaculaceae bacterium]
MDILQHHGHLSLLNPLLKHEFCENSGIKRIGADKRYFKIICFPHSKTTFTQVVSHPSGVAFNAVSTNKVNYYFPKLQEKMRKTFSNPIYQILEIFCFFLRKEVNFGQSHFPP